MLSHSMETYFGTPYDNNLSDRIALANMRCIIDNTRAMIASPDDLAPRGALPHIPGKPVWRSAS